MVETNLSIHGVLVEDFIDGQVLALRRMLARSAARVIAVTGGADGVGRTAAVVNLALALTEQGMEVVVLDECPGGRSASALLSSVHAGGTFTPVLCRKMPPVLAVERRSSRFSLNGAGRMDRKHYAVGRNEAVLDGSPDLVLIDAALDRNGALSPIASQAHDIIVVTLLSADAVADAYVCMKRIRLAHGIEQFRVLINHARSEADTDPVLNCLADVARDYLAVSVVKAGSIAADPSVAQAVELSCCIFDAFPMSPAVRDFRRFAANVDSWVTRPVVSSQLGHSKARNYTGGLAAFGSGA